MIALLLERYVFDDEGGESIKQRKDAETVLRFLEDQGPNGTGNHCHDHDLAQYVAHLLMMSTCFRVLPLAHAFESRT